MHLTVEKNTGHTAIEWLRKGRERREENREIGEREEEEERGKKWEQFSRRHHYFDWIDILTTILCLKRERLDSLILTNHKREEKKWDCKRESICR